MYYVQDTLHGTLATLRHLIRNCVLPTVTPNITIKAINEINLGAAYLFRCLNRLHLLYVAWIAGTYRPSKPRPNRAKSTKPRKPGLPGTKAWFTRHSAELRVIHLFVTHWMNAQPKFAEFVAAVPSARRILRPVHTLLMMDIPPELALPPKPRREPKPRAPRPPKPPRETKYWKPHTGPYPGVPDRHRLKIPGINAPRLPEDRKRKKA